MSIKAKICWLHIKNIDSSEFIAVLDDALQALENNDVAQREKEEVLYILYCMKAQVVLV